MCRSIFGALGAIGKNQLGNRGLPASCPFMPRGCKVATLIPSPGKKSPPCIPLSPGPKSNPSVIGPNTKFSLGAWKIGFFYPKRQSEQKIVGTGADLGQSGESERRIVNPQKRRSQPVGQTDRLRGGKSFSLTITISIFSAKHGCNKGCPVFTNSYCMYGDQ